MSQCKEITDLELKLDICKSAPSSTKLHAVLKKFAERCAVVSWFLQLLPHTFSLEKVYFRHENLEFSHSDHVRHSLSNRDGGYIEEWYWPALFMERENEAKTCLSKGVVLTTDEL